MSFALACIESPGVETIRIMATRKVRLGGPEGPLARHILSLKEPNWQWDGTDLAQSLCPVEWGESPVWLIWETEDENPRKIHTVSGVSMEFSTDVVLQMELLEKVGDDSYQPLGKFVGEALGLSGGRLTPKAKWTWGTPKMMIGSVTLA